MVDFIITNEQDKLPFTDELRSVVEQAVETTLSVLSWGDVLCQVSVLITDDENIRTLNRIHRGIDRATDVLSFPLIEFDEEGNALVDDSDYENGALLLGDIVISLERAKAQSEEYSHSLKREVGFLSLHSALHLMGFDHIKDEDAAVMRPLEKEIAEKMDLKR